MNQMMNQSQTRSSRTAGGSLVDAADGWLEEGLVAAIWLRIFRHCCQEIAMVILEIESHWSVEFCMNWHWNWGTGELIDNL